MEKLVILAVVIWALLIATGPVTEPTAQAAHLERPSPGRAALTEPVMLERAPDGAAPLSHAPAGARARVADLPPPALVEEAGQPEVLAARPFLCGDAAQRTCRCCAHLGLLAQGVPRTLSSLVTFLLRTTADAVRLSVLEPSRQQSL
jgi:hypothetical protein